MECDDITLSIVEEDDINFSIDGEASPSSFLSLTDTPESYSGQSGKVVKVNSTGTGLEFAEDSGLVDSVNGQTGAVVLDTDDILEGTNKYDKTVALTAGDGIEVTGTYPDFTITNISEGNTDHSALDNLDYANSGHTGFQPTLTAGTNVDITNNIISATDTTYSAGDGIDITGNVISNTGVLTESDPVFSSWDKSTGISITESQISDFGNYLTSETDPVWTSEKANYQLTSEKGQNNGYASLDSGGKVPVSELPNSIVEYKGTWNATTNSPTLIDGTGNAGDVYIVSIAGTQNLGSGNISFLEGDWVMYNGTIWQKSINSNAVVSVNSQTGVVSLDTDDIDEGTTNLYDKEVSFTGGTNVTIGGEYPSFTITDNSANSTDISTALGNYVPYTGATNDVDLGNYDLTATDITSEGNVYISNSKFIKGRNYADSAEVDILKVNTEDEVEAGADFNFGLMEYATITEPISPDQESTYMYQEATGTRPNRTISLLIKNELGEKIILSTLIV